MPEKDPAAARAEAKLAAAIESMRHQLTAASAAAHELEPDDEHEADYDRTMWLGLMTDALAQLCGPKARVLLELAEQLLQLDEPADNRSPREQAALREQPRLQPT